MHSGVTHERCADFRHGKKRKKQKRGEFITPPRPTGRRSNDVTTCAAAYRATVGTGAVNPICLSEELVIILKGYGKGIR